MDSKTSSKTSSSNSAPAPTAAAPTAAAADTTSRSVDKDINEIKKTLKTGGVGDKKEDVMKKLDEILDL
jgi:hypothetical protein